MKQPVIFLVGSAVCGGLDFGLSIFFSCLGKPPHVAVFYGWIGGVISGYFFHQLITFKLTNKKIDFMPFFMFFLNCVFLLALRVGLLEFFGMFKSRSLLPQTYIICLVIFVSLLLNFVISKFFVFKKSRG